ncbi:acylamino-acid-releasing enzyme isoform X1 [Herrania umbratica]|uniref:acylaminoacyl-peptidase n=2 Tax=Herrania umbratica TaxID=108875 RepID=A0A6J1AZ94_9ROSI|nr:acylamino-acid-releasing enzyme isoform X1 [Herrania umbratica]
MSRTLALASFHRVSTISNWSVTLATSPRLSPPFFSVQLRRPSLFHLTPISHYTKKLSAVLAMDSSKAGLVKELPVGLDEATEEEYASQSKLLQEFTSISSIDKAWIFKSDSGKGSQAMFSISQPNLLANKKRKFMLSSSISKESINDVNFQWAPFPIEMTGVSLFVPSPSGSKLLVIRNPENESPSQFEIWSSSQLEKEFLIPQSVHGSVYADGWFEGISWNSDESLIAYVAEEPSPSKPSFDDQGYRKGAIKDKECCSWKAQGDWDEEWGECYAGKRQPALFVINVNSGKVQAVKGIAKSLSVGQVVWAPQVEGTEQYLVFVGWSADPRKLGIKYCYNRPCALYAVKAPLYKSEAAEFDLKSMEESTVVNLTQSISSAFFPRFSPDGKFLMFLSAKASVDSGAHSATDSLKRIDWPTGGKLWSSTEIIDVIPIVNCAEDGHLPGLYCSNFLTKPWLSDGCTVILSSYWHSCQVILSVNLISGKVLRISPADSDFSWNVLTLDGDNIIAVCSSPIDVPQIKYGCLVDKATNSTGWCWSNVSSPIFRCSEKVMSLLSSHQFSILQIPVKDVSDCLTKGAAKPFEAIFVSSKKNDETDPLIVLLHGGPHSVSLSSFSKSLAFLFSIGYSLLIVNYRGSLGFGEEALQSLPGKIGSQDVNDVLTAIDYVIEKGLANPSKITVLGGSHGGFLTTHLIGQAPDKFVAVAVRNPVCNLSSMVGITDIPDWCYVESYGSNGKSIYTEAPSAEHLTHLYNKSPISHISKVKAPTLFLLGAQDLRVPVSNGLQYARALKERGVETKVIVFPSDIHAIERPQSDFESSLNIGVWFKKYCK